MMHASGTLVHIQVVDSVPGEEIFVWCLHSREQNDCWEHFTSYQSYKFCVVVSVARRNGLLWSCLPRVKNCWVDSLKFNYFSSVLSAHNNIFFPFKLQYQFPVNSQRFWAFSMLKSTVFINFRDSILFILFINFRAFLESNPYWLSTRAILFMRKLAV